MTPSTSPTASDPRLPLLLAAAERHFEAFLAESRDILRADAIPDRSARFIWKEGDFHLIPPDKIHDEIGQSLQSTATWEVIERHENESQRWPDGNIDTYGELIVYRGEGFFAGVKLALGFATTANKDHEVVGFVIGASARSKRPLTVFFPADDYDTSHEVLSMIRGKNGGRGGFSPAEILPAEYAGFQTAILGERIPGKWNVQAVTIEDTEAGRQIMLNHTAVQARLRGLI